MGAGEPVRLVLESDGTQVEDGEYWRTLPPNTVLLLLRTGERWYPTGVDVIKAGQSSADMSSTGIGRRNDPPSSFFSSHSYIRNTEDSMRDHPRSRVAR